MEEVLRITVEALVENKDAIKIESRQENGKDYYTVEVAKEEMGKLIGKQGKVSRAIKTIARALAAKEGRKVEVEIK